MKNMLCRLGAVCVFTVLVAASSPQINAQVASGVSPTKSPSDEETNQAELLKSYLQLREHLQATQLAIASSRVEAETAERNQTVGLAEKLEAIKSAMDADRERTRLESQRAQVQRAETERQQLERLNRTILWIAGIVGSVAFLAVVVGPLLQWRAINRLTQVVASLSRPGALTQPAPATTESRGSDQAVVASTQRVQAMIDRMERRISELENTADRPSPTGTVATTSTYISAQPNPRTVSSNDHATRIRLLLGNGHALLAAGKAKEAIGCYNEVLKLDLNHAEALVKRGAALERLKQDDEAIQCYDRAIRADAKMTLAYLYKGGVCNRLERYEEASRCYEQALRTEDESRAAAHVVDRVYPADRL
jgi:tetratricopeptide (TPR) repeat protein